MLLRIPGIASLVAMLLLAPALTVRAQNAPTMLALDHVELFVSNITRSQQFYTRLFGAEVWKNKQTERRYLRLGTGYLALEEQKSAHVDHVCFSVKDFDMDRMHRWLKGQGLLWHDYPSGNDLRVDDRDGTRVQLAAPAGWEQIEQKVAAPLPNPAKVEGLFHPLALDEVFITVTNLEVDSLHYARLLGKTGIMSAGSLWFDLGSARLRLSQAPVGQAPGMNYFSVLISNTDLQAAAEAVFKAGGIIENILPNGFSFWDPDGLRVEVHLASLF